MNEQNEDLELELTEKLRIKLSLILTEFYIENKNISQDSIFVINSTVMTSLIASVTYGLYKKDCEDGHQFSYIDLLCDRAKKELQNFKKHISEKTQFVN